MSRLRSNPGVQLEVRGKRYDSIRALADAYGLSARAVARRLHAKWPVEEAVGLVPHKSRTKSPKQTALVYEGQPFASQKALAEHLGLKPLTLSARIRMRGLNLAALTAEALLPDRRKTEPTRGVSITFRDETFASYARLCRKYNTNPQMFLKRRKRGCTLEQALGLEPLPPRDMIPNPAEACATFPVAPAGRLRGTEQAKADHPDLV
jgi:lambda repressor-like predicted transcriptional regulator